MEWMNRLLKNQMKMNWRKTDIDPEKNKEAALELPNAGKIIEETYEIYEDDSDSGFLFPTESSDSDGYK